MKCFSTTQDAETIKNAKKETGWKSFVSLSSILCNGNLCC